MGPFATTSPSPQGSRRRAAPEALLAALLALSALAAAATLLARFAGLERTAAFRHLGQYAPAILWAQAIAVAMFLGDRLVRLLAAANRAEYLGTNGFDLALPAAALAVAGLVPPWRGEALGAGALYVLITQAYAAVAGVVRRTASRTQQTRRGAPTAWLVLGGMLALCLAGSLLLTLPVAVQEDAYISWDYGDAAFTAVSAVTGTGLTLKPTGAHFTFFGQAVILLLVQAGAMAILFAGVVLARLAGRAMWPSSPGEALTRRRGPAVGFVLAATLVCEGIGAIALYPMFAAAHRDGSTLSGIQAAWYSLFHSVSAFCNAGFSLYPRGFMHGLNEGWDKPLRDAWQMYGVIAPLIVLGGLGMSVLSELAGVPGRLLRRPGALPMSAHARLVLAATAIAIVVGAAGLMGIESAPRGKSPEKIRRWVDEADRPASGESLIPGERRLSALPPGQRMGQSIFESISVRSAGFSTVDPGDLTPGGTLWLCAMMTVGGAPGGAAGGLKVTVLAVLVLAAGTTLAGRWARPGPRRVSLHVLARAVTLTLVYVCVVGAVTVLLCLATGWDSRFFLKLLVEACSACGNVGVSVRVSETLGRGMALAKCALVAGMLFGKAGMTAMALSLLPPPSPEGQSDEWIV
ncbi:MAG: hypothetical protein NT031_18215 [Planctomycetota bacterium]|nr:hypothetical protein [Planctomycetota bacterium]